MGLLKPVNNWPAFAGEVAIIVIGVLIALSAEEIVQRLNWRQQVREARGALDAQLGESQASALERIANSKCDARRLDRLDDLIARGALPELDLSELGYLRLWSTSSWDAAAASGAVAHMTPEWRNRYADLFSFTAVLGEMNRKEFDLIAELRTLERHRELTETSRDRLTRTISQLRSYNRMMTLGAGQWLENAKPLRLQLPEDAKEALAQATPCKMPDKITKA